MLRMDIFKSPKFITIFSMAITLVVSVISNFLFGSDILPFEYSTLPILSLLLGPYAVLGFIIVEIIDWIFFFKISDVWLMLFNLIFITILGILPWKLWYSILNRRGHELPNMNNTFSFIKALIILLIIVIQSYILINNSYCIIDASNFGLFNSAMVMSFVSMLIVIGLFGKFKIPMYTPKIQITQVMPVKIYDAALLASIIIQAFLILSSSLNHGTLISISLILTLVFLIKPYDNEVLKMDNILKLTIFYKTCISIFFIILIMTAFIVLTIIGRAIFIDQLISTASREELLDLYISSFSNILMAFIIPMIIYMLFLERYVVNPINRLSNYISQEINTIDDIDELKDNLKSIKVNNEIKSLSQSLVNMEKELVDYGEDLIKLTKDQERYETELKLAHDIQYSMIPTDFEEFNKDKNINLWGSMEAAREVGGDFYDYFQIDDDNVGFVIGDVSGKGVTAALIMVKAMTLIQEYAKQYDNLSKVFYEVNNELCEGNSETLFVTCWLGKINTKTGELSYVNAGHNPPLVKNGDSFEYMNSSPDLVLAAMEDMPYETHEIQLNSNDAIFLYTDGVTEANDNYNGFYGDERLKNILNEHQNDEVSAIIDCVKKDIDEFCNSQEQFDDTTMIIVRMN